MRANVRIEVSGISGEVNRVLVDREDISHKIKDLTFRMSVHHTPILQVTYNCHQVDILSPKTEVQHYCGAE